MAAFTGTMGTMARRLKKKSGDILKIDMAGGFHAYAHVSDHGVLFYDRRLNVELSLVEIAALPVAFRVRVYDHALKDERWQKVGHQPLASHLLEEPYKFKQDEISGRLAIYHGSFADTNYERPATLSECQGLEPAAVWEVEQVEDRLKDHFNGAPNMWVLSLAIDPSRFPADQK